MDEDEHAFLLSRPDRSAVRDSTKIKGDFEILCRSTTKCHVIFRRANILDVRRVEWINSISVFCSVVCFFVPTLTMTMSRGRMDSILNSLFYITTGSLSIILELNGRVRVKPLFLYLSRCEDSKKEQSQCGIRCDRDCKYYRY